MKQTPIRRVSDKRAAQMPQYHDILEAIGLCSQSLSELGGKWPVIPHHIHGRRGEHLYDPFNIILVTDAEHREIHAHNTPELKEKLAAIVKEIRLKQGFIPNE